MIATLRHDLRLALRAARRRPGFTATCVGTLAVGMGATIAIFSVLNAVVLRDLPWAHAGRTMVVARLLDSGVQDPDFSERELQTFAREAPEVERVGGFVYGGATLSLAGRPMGLWFTHVTADLFETLGARPQAGRLFQPEEFQEGAHRVVVLSDVLWREVFGADPNVVGTSVVLDGIPRRVVGVAPPDFRMPTDFRWEGQTEIWAPLPLAQEPKPGGSRYLWMVARLSRDATREGAVARLDVVLRNLATAVPGDYGTNPPGRVKLTPVTEEVLGTARPALLLLMGAVGFVLLIACTNVAHLLLARAEERQSDLALRSALGAGRGRLLREALVESLLLGLAAAGLGLVIAHAAIPPMVALAPVNLPRLERVSIDATVLAFATVAAILTPLLFGLMPALRASRSALTAALQPGGRGGTEAARGTRRALITAEVALAVALLAASSLLVKSFARVTRVDPGFDAERLVAGDVVLPASRYADDAKALNVFDAVRELAASRPGVQKAGLSTTVPYWNPAGRAAFEVDSRPHAEGARPTGAWQAISPGFFETTGMRLVDGRDFAEGEGEGAQPVAIVSRTVARSVFEDRAVGRRIRLADANTRPWLEIVGVVEDVRDEAADRAPRGQVYVPFRQAGAAMGRTPRYMALFVRTPGKPGALVPDLRKTLAAVDPDLPLSSVRALDDRLAQSSARYRFAAVLLVLLAAVALGLSAVGIFALTAYTVGRRQREIAIRMALGARATRVLRAVFTEGVLTTAAGLVLGSAIAFALTRYLGSVLYEVSPTDPAAFVTAVVGLGAAAALATWLPARRALRVDPALLLRGE
jgi:predicted permease